MSKSNLEASGSWLSEPTLPAQVTFVSASPDGACQEIEADRRINCQIVHVPGGGQASLVLRLRADELGTFDNVASVGAARDDPDPNNNRVTVRTTVLPDEDADGVPDEAERGPAGNDPDYDGNGDGTPDRLQSHVASLATAPGAYITLEATSQDGAQPRQ